MKPSYEAVTAAHQAWNKSNGMRLDAWRAALSAAYAIDWVGAGVRLAMSDEEARQKAADWWSGCHSRAWLTLEYLIEVVRATVPADAPQPVDARDAEIARLAMTDEEAAKDALDFWDARWGPRQTSEERMLQLVRRVRATVPADAPAFQAAPGLDMKVEGAFSMGAIKRNTDPADAPPQPDPRDAEIAELRRQIRMKEDYEKRLLDDITELRKAARETPAAVVHVRPFSVRDIKGVRQAAREAAEAAKKWSEGKHGISDVVDALANAFRAIAGDDK